MLPKPLERYNGGLIIRDRDEDGKLDPVKDEIVGGFEIEAPAGASGFQVLTPIVSNKPFLSVPTTPD